MRCNETFPTPWRPRPVTLAHPRRQALTETQRQLDEKTRELEKLEGQAIGTEAEDYTLKSELYEKELALEVGPPT